MSHRRYGSLTGELQLMLLLVMLQSLCLQCGRDSAGCLQGPLMLLALHGLARIVLLHDRLLY